jgi:hypothetical protein
MELSKTKLKIVTGILASLLILSAAGNVYFWNSMHTSTVADDQDKDDFTTSLSTQTGDINRLNKRLAEIEQQNGLLQEQVGELDGLLKQANNQVWELRTRKSNPVANLSPAQVGRNGGGSDQLAMLSSNEQLNAQIASLQDSLNALANQKLAADNFRIVAFKRNSKETAKAKKVDKLTISLNMPAANGGQEAETVFLSLINPEGNGISSPLETLTLRGPEGKKTVPVHAKKVVDLEGRASWQQVTFTIQETDNIKPGTYRAFLYTQSKYLGSVQVQFRDSFWFF